MAGPVTQIAPASVRTRPYRYYEFCTIGFVVVLLCSNLIGPGKTALVSVPDWLTWLTGSATVAFGVGNIFFPISYIFGDVLTEVYGYARARRVIWAGFGAMLFATLMSAAVIALPPDPQNKFNEVLQPSLEWVFGNTWRIVLASILGFWVGDFVNSYVMAKMKVWTAGRFLWTRTIGSTLVGQFFDSILFYPIAFYGVWDNATLLKVALFNWLFKVAVEVLMTPMTYLVINWLKRAEGENHFDTDTNFTPFSLKA